MTEEVTWEAARERAIALGALKPRNIAERTLAGMMATQGQGSFAETPVAQARLREWTQAIMEGRDPTKP
ncbi:MAG: hypothetical protein JSR21_13610 [Proteobacteria bacterium]|nr:hypothetical protein [Pseudomonadota bacterium]